LKLPPARGDNPFAPLELHELEPDSIQIREFGHQRRF